MSDAHIVRRRRMAWQGWRRRALSSLTKGVSSGRLDLVTLPNVTIGRAVFEPGWRWSEHVKPIAGTDSCLQPHTGYVVSGRLATRMDDGQELEFGAGEAFYIPPGHDGWTVGNEAAVVLDITGMENYAKPT
jgi:quercetin dioxygenase-like cupin family protein